jgi:hypothetical protein
MTPPTQRYAVGQAVPHLRMVCPPLDVMDMQPLLGAAPTTLELVASLDGEAEVLVRSTVPVSHGVLVKPQCGQKRYSG